MSLPDVQNRPDTRGITLDRVGVTGFECPVAVKVNGYSCDSVAKFDMYVNIPADKRGANMSRFVEDLDVSVFPTNLNLKTLSEFLGALRNKMPDSQDVFVRSSFSLWLKKKAPVSGKSGYITYPAYLSVRSIGDTIHLMQGITVPIATLCPCSKEISEYGAHNQRAHVDVGLWVKQDISWVSLIPLLESTGSTGLYPVLKRPDEKYVTEHAYNNPKFVEDVARDAALVLNNLNDVIGYSVKAESIESIHTHNAVAYVKYNWSF